MICALEEPVIKSYVEYKGNNIQIHLEKLKTSDGRVKYKLTATEKARKQAEVKVDEMYKNLDDALRDFTRLCVEYVQQIDDSLI